MPVAITILMGLSLGLFSRLSGSLPDGLRWVGNVGALWLAVAFFSGRSCRATRSGAVAGGASLAIASLVHYVPFRMVRGEITLEVLRFPVGLWLSVGLVAGACFGALGAAHAGGLRTAITVGTAVLAASFAAEALVLLLVAHPNAVAVAVPVEILCAVILPLVLVRSGRQRMLSYFAMLLMIPLAMLGLTSMMGVIQRVYPGV